MANQRDAQGIRAFTEEGAEVLKRAKHLSWVIFSLLMIQILLTTSMPLPFTVPETRMTGLESPSRLTALELQIPHSSIGIVNDTDFHQQAILEGWLGNGTSESPYVIGGYSIMSDFDCIAIQDTTVHFRIVDCQIWSLHEIGVGIRLYNTPNCVIDNCTIRWKDYGIQVSYTSNFSAVNNRIYRINDIGIGIEYTDNCDIFHNELSECMIAIHMAEGDNFTLSLNNVQECEQDSIRIWDSTNCTLTENYVHDNLQGGIILSDVDSGSMIANAIIRNGQGEIDVHKLGLLLTGCSFLAVNRNIISSNYDEGIRVYQCASCAIEENTLDSNGWGIIMSEAPHCVIKGNEITNSKHMGIYVGSSDDVAFTHNVIVCSGQDGTLNSGGLSLVQSSGCEVHNNKLYDNEGYGINLEYSSNCCIHHNEIGWNSMGNSFESSHAFDNVWFDPILEEGNYWSNYNGTGTYEIGGSQGSTDLYPFPLLCMNHPSDIEHAIFTANTTITWSVYAVRPGTYEILHNGQTVEAENWFGTIITCDLTDLVRGPNNVTLVLHDTLGHKVSDSVLIMNPPLPEVPLEMLGIAVICVTLLAAGIVLWYARTRTWRTP